MTKLAALAMIAVLGVGVGVAQTSPAAQAGATDSQTLKDILMEMRTMHNDVRLSQSSQILLAEMLMQRVTVDKALGKRDDLRNRVSQIQSTERSIATQIAQDEDNLKALTMDQVQSKRITDQENMMKSQAANFKTQETDAANMLLDADTALRKEQEALDNIQSQLDAVIKQLQPAGR
jgi:hypothetical protein